MTVVAQAIDPVGCAVSKDWWMGRPIVRRMQRHNAIEAWTHMRKTGWKLCQPSC